MTDRPLFQPPLDPRPPRPGRSRRALATVVALAGLVGVVVSPPGPAQAVENGVGLIKITNTANGTYASIDTNGYPSPGSGLSASRSDVIKVKAWELKPNARYALWFIWPDAVAFGVECRFAKIENGTGRIMENALAPGFNLKKMKTNEFGNFDRDPTVAGLQAYKALIPDDDRVNPGTAEICGREVWPFADHTTTQHVRLTIL